jgi:hypothetical protein
MNMDQILKDMDKHAAEFNFPVLDNAYVEFGCARLSAFQSLRDWLVVFEVLGFSTKELCFVNDLYAYGSCAEQEGFVGALIPLSASEENPIFDTHTNECIADWSHWSIEANGETMSFSPTLEDYLDSGIAISQDAGPGSLSEIDLLRFLLDRLGEDRLFMNDHEILEKFLKCRGLSKFLQTTAWQHPDVANGEIPSANISIRTLVAAISARNASLFEPGSPNTHWRSWPNAS